MGMMMENLEFLSPHDMPSDHLVLCRRPAMLSPHELDSRLCARHRQDNLSMPIWLAALANGGDDGSDVIRFTDVPDAGVSSHGCAVLAKTTMLVYAPMVPRWLQAKCG